jgi:hypothetical protein
LDPNRLLDDGWRNARSCLLLPNQYSLAFQWQRPILNSDPHRQKTYTVPIRNI